LTDERIRAEPTPTKAKKLNDGRGLFLLLQARGRPTWRLKYTFAKAEKSLTLGPYGNAADEVSIDRARKLAEAARAMLKETPPRDPAAERRYAAERQYLEQTTTFGKVGREYLQLDDTRAERTVDKHEWLFGLLAPLHNRAISTIEPPDILKVLRGLEQRGKREAAHRASQFAARVFRYAIQTGALRGKVNPAADLRGALEPVDASNHAAITKPEAFGVLMSCIDAEGYAFASVRNGLRLLARTALRSSELRCGLWQEIDWEKCEWRIPGPRMKMKREHLVPLSTQAMAILREQQEITGDGALMFPGLRNGRPMSDAAMGIGLKQFVGSDLQTPHGLRTSFSTLMHEAGHESELIELQLSHRKRGAIRSVYDKSERVAERATLMQAWSDTIDELKARRVTVTSFASALTSSTALA
jgi:integrase